MEGISLLFCHSSLVANWPSVLMIGKQTSDESQLMNLNHISGKMYTVLCKSLEPLPNFFILVGK